MVLFKHLLHFPIIYCQYTTFKWIFGIMTLYPVILLNSLISISSFFDRFCSVFYIDNIFLNFFNVDLFLREKEREHK